MTSGRASDSRNAVARLIGSPTSFGSTGADLSSRLVSKGEGPIDAGPAVPGGGDGDGVGTAGPIGVGTSDPPCPRPGTPTVDAVDGGRDGEGRPPGLDSGAAGGGM